MRRSSDRGPSEVSRFAGACGMAGSDTSRPNSPPRKPAGGKARRWSSKAQDFLLKTIKVE